MAKTKKKKFRQVAALPYRLNGAGYEVVLVTTRVSGRWILPKGWPIKGQRDNEAAATEAFEEAGLVGRSRRTALDRFTYAKKFERRTEKVVVDVYPLEIVEQRRQWREKDEREVKAFSPIEAAAKVAEPAIANLILNFFASLEKADRTIAVSAEATLA